MTCPSGFTRHRFTKAGAPTNACVRCGRIITKWMGKTKKPAQPLKRLGF